MTTRYTVTSTAAEPKVARSPRVAVADANRRINSGRGDVQISIARGAQVLDLQFNLAHPASETTLAIALFNNPITDMPHTVSYEPGTVKLKPRPVEAPLVEVPSFPIDRCAACLKEHWGCECGAIKRGVEGHMPAGCECGRPRWHWVSVRVCCITNGHTPGFRCSHCGEGVSA